MLIIQNTSFVLSKWTHSVLIMLIFIITSLHCFSSFPMDTSYLRIVLIYRSYRSLMSPEILHFDKLLSGADSDAACSKNTFGVGRFYATVWNAFPTYSLWLGPNGLFPPDSCSLSIHSEVNIVFPITSNTFLIHFICTCPILVIILYVLLSSKGPCV